MLLHTYLLFLLTGVLLLNRFIVVETSNLLTYHFNSYDLWGPLIGHKRTEVLRPAGCETYLRPDGPTAIGSCGIREHSFQLGSTFPEITHCSVVYCIIMLQVGQLSQANRATACISFRKNISAKSVHLTSLYPTALTSTNDVDCFTSLCLCLMQNCAAFRR